MTLHRMKGHLISETAQIIHKGLSGDLALHRVLPDNNKAVLLQT